MSTQEDSQGITDIDSKFDRWIEKDSPLNRPHYFVRYLMKNAFKGGHDSRDGEVAALKATIVELSKSRCQDSPTYSWQIGTRVYVKPIDPYREPEPGTLVSCKKHCSYEVLLDSGQRISTFEFWLAPLKGD